MALLAKKEGWFVQNDESYIIEVETDRCPADGVLISAGLSVGGRRFHVRDYGKCAARFINAKTSEGIRLYFKSSLKPEKGQDIIDFFENVPDNELFSITPIRQVIPTCNLPGMMDSQIPCTSCGELIQDHREIFVEGAPFCFPCYARQIGIKQRAC